MSPAFSLIKSKSWPALRVRFESQAELYQRPFSLLRPVQASNKDHCQWSQRVFLHSASWSLIVPLQVRSTSAPSRACASHVPWMALLSLLVGAEVLKLLFILVFPSRRFEVFKDDAV